MSSIKPSARTPERDSLDQSPSITVMFRVAAVRALRPDDGAALTRLYRSVYARSISSEEMSWKHPGIGGHSGVVAEDAGDLVAHYGGWLRAWQVGPHRGRAVVALDAMTAPSHRGRGLFSALVREAHDQWRESGVSLVLGLPNSPSVAQAQRLRPVARLRLSRMQAHLELPGRLLSGQVASAAKMRGPLRWIRRLNSRLATARQSLHWLSFDQVPSPSSPGSNGLVRDLPWLRWRYQAHPLSPYRAFGLQEHGGQWSAWGVVRLVGRDPGVAQVAEIHGSARAKVSLLAALLDQDPPEIQRIEAFFPDADRLVARCAGFWIRRQDAPVHAAVLGGDASHFLEGASLHWGDFDLV